MAAYKNVVGMLLVVVGLLHVGACGQPESGGVGSGGNDASPLAETSVASDSSPTSTRAPVATVTSQGPAVPVVAPCVISGAGYPSGATRPGNDCEACQPEVSPVGWTARPDATSCSSGNGNFCRGGTCVSGCLVDGRLFASQQPKPSDSCDLCEPSKSSTTFSASHHAGCGRPKAACDIGGTKVADGTMAPGNPNACCNTSLSSSRWSPGFESLGVGAVSTATVETAALADVNNDGILDLVVATPDGFKFLTGDGSGAFAQAEEISGGIQSVSVADLNGDGRPDVIVLSQDDTDQIAAVTVILNDAIPNNLGFTSKSYSVPWPAVALAVGDFRQVGFDDIAVISGPSSQAAGISTLLNTGGGAFRPGLTGTLPFANPTSAVAARFGGGARDQLAVVDGLDQALAVFEYIGSFGFGFTAISQSALPVGSSNLSLAQADINRDGLPDLLVGDTDGGSVRNSVSE